MISHSITPLLAKDVSRGDKLIAVDSWMDVCQWIQKETSPTACFLTPRGASSFIWRAQRSEVVAWKNLPCLVYWPPPQ